MGDRSNIVVVQPDESRIYLYGHWMGTDAIRITHDVMATKARWAEHAYLARMLFSKMIEGDFDGETGFGISNTPCDNEYPIIVINPAKQTVFIESDYWQKPSEPITPEVSFEEFVNASAVSETYADLAVAMGAKLTPA